MLIHQRKLLQTQSGVPTDRSSSVGWKSGSPQPLLLWADCHIPHTDYPIPGARSLAERQADATPLSPKGNLANYAGAACQRTTSENRSHRSNPAPIERHPPPHQR